MHAGITASRPSPCVCAGVNSFKFFLAYKGALQVSDQEFLAGLKRCKELGALPMVRRIEGWRAGVLACWLAGLLVCWCASVLVCWCTGVLACWCAGVLACWCAGELSSLILLLSALDAILLCVRQLDNSLSGLVSRSNHRSKPPCRASCLLRPPGYHTARCTRRTATRWSGVSRGWCGWGSRGPRLTHCRARQRYLPAPHRSTSRCSMERTGMPLCPLHFILSSLISSHIVSSPVASSHLISSPFRVSIQVEGEATVRAIRLARLVGVPLYVVHVMSEDAANEVAAARRRGEGAGCLAAWRGSTTDLLPLSMAWQHNRLAASHGSNSANSPHLNSFPPPPPPLLSSPQLEAP